MELLGHSFSTTYTKMPPQTPRPQNRMRCEFSWILPDSLPTRYCALPVVMAWQRLQAMAKWPMGQQKKEFYRFYAIFDPIYEVFCSKVGVAFWQPF